MNQKIFYLLAILIFGFCQVFFFFSIIRPIVGLFIIGIVIFGNFFLEKKDFLFKIYLISLSLAGVIFLSLLRNPFSAIILGIILSGAILIFWENLYRIYYLPRLSEPYFFQESSYWLSVIFGFFAFSAIFGWLEVFSQYFLVYLFSVPIIFLINFWLGYYFLKVQGADISFNLLLESLILTEFYIILNHFPNIFYLNGLTMSIISITINILWLKYFRFFEKKKQLL